MFLQSTGASREGDEVGRKMGLLLQQVQKLFNSSVHPKPE